MRSAPDPFPLLHIFLACQGYLSLCRCRQRPADEILQRKVLKLFYGLIFIRIRHIVVLLFEWVRVILCVFWSVQIIKQKTCRFRQVFCFGGCGWIRKPRPEKQSAGLFFPAGGRDGLFSSHPLKPQNKKPADLRRVFRFGGSGWIRTTEAIMQQIYSLPPLAAREHSHMFPRSIECLSIIARQQRKCKSFFDFCATFFRKQMHGRCVQKFVTPQMPFCGIITK